jgi:hypothetical protein
LERIHFMLLKRPALIVLFFAIFLCQCVPKSKKKTDNTPDNANSQNELTTKAPEVEPIDFSATCQPASTKACTCAESVNAISSQSCAVDGKRWHPCECKSVGLMLYVDAKAGAGGSGELQKPFSSLTEAKNSIRELKKKGSLPALGINVYLRSGVYLQTESLQFTSEDSGEKDSPVQYSAYPGESVSIRGGTLLSPDWFTRVPKEDALWSKIPETSRSHVFVASLKSHGITDFGVLERRGFRQKKLATAEFFSNGARRPLARWPNFKVTGNVQTGMTAIKDSNNSDEFSLYSQRPKNWVGATGFWAHGFFSYDWADYHVPVASSSNEAKIKLVSKPGAGPKNGQGVYFYNLIQELDEAGEYFIDRESGKLYFWPDKDITKSELVLSTLKEPIISLNGAQHLNFKNLIVEYSRSSLLKIKDSKNISFESSMLRHSGNIGLEVEGQDILLKNLRVYSTGDGGIEMTGGDRKSLSPGNIKVELSKISHFGLWTLTMTPGVQMFGAGNSALNNEISQGAHSAIMYWGNDHKISQNEVFEVCQETSDAGAIYTGRDWGARGNEVSNNIIRDIKSSNDGENGVHGVYLDDAASGVRVFGNIFYNITGFAVQLGGGRDSVIENNIFMKNGEALRADARVKVWPKIPSTEQGNDWNLLEKLQVLDYRSKVWSEKFPLCAQIPNSWTEILADKEKWLTPRGTIFNKNLGFKNKSWIKAKDNASSYFASVKDNKEDADPKFADEAKRNFNLPNNSGVQSIPNWEKIPVETIGLKRSW